MLDRAAPAAVAVVALAALVWAAAEFLETGDRAPLVVAGRAAAAEVVAERVAFHEIMPEAADDLGRPVILDGTVAVTGASGIWVRDLRGYTVYVGNGGGAELWTFAPGDPVRIRGQIALLSGGEANRRLREIEGNLGSDALLVRGVMIVPEPGGVEALLP